MTPGVERGKQLMPAWARIPRLLIGFLVVVSSGGAWAVESDASLIEYGRRIYQEGVLPNGEPLQAVRPEGFTLEGRYAACVTCHRRSGMGSVEGSVESTILVPPVAGPGRQTTGGAHAPVCPR